MMAHSHFLEFYRPGKARIGQNAGRFLAQGLLHDGVAVAIATPAAQKGILAEIERANVDAQAAIENGRLVLFQSAAMLSQFMGRREVNAESFDSTVASAMRAAKRHAGDGPLHAFGDMVGVLWQRDEREAAVALERLWNDLQRELGFRLYCAYPIDIFGGDFCTAALHGVLETHSHFSPTPASAELGRALDRALDDVLGTDASQVRARSGERSFTRLAMPKIETLIFWLRDNMPQHADAVLARAREYYDGAGPRTYLRQQHSSR